VTRTVTRIAVLAVAVTFAGVVAGSTEPQALATAFSSRSPIGRQPLWLQAIELFVLADFLGYWIHRWFHRARGWRFHAVHHSAQRLDWLSSVRVHPVNDLLGTLCRAMPLFVLGFRLELVAAWAPLLVLWGLALHANVWWRFGPLRFVISSPAFHRWHHACEQEGRDKNFAGLFPIWDLLFGTYHLPATPPRRCGIDDPVPDGFWGQLAYPWRAHDVHRPSRVGVATCSRSR
jgi:sterol desaturase/sphingolipid hydroxylase (fatty acid hydroxylase superfamily)